MTDILRTIATYKRREISRAKVSMPLETLARKAHDHDPPRGFVKAIEARRNNGQIALIAEIKNKWIDHVALGPDGAVARTCAGDGETDLDRCRRLWPGRCLRVKTLSGGEKVQARERPSSRGPRLRRGARACIASCF